MEEHQGKPLAFTQCLRLMESEESTLAFLYVWDILVLDQQSLWFQALSIYTVLKPGKEAPS